MTGASGRPSGKHPLADRTIYRSDGLGVCPRCDRGIGRIGFWLGAKYGEVVVCDRCAFRVHPWRGPGAAEDILEKGADNRAD